MRLRDSAYLLYQTTRCAFLVSEKNSLLGLLWHMLHPLAMTLVLCVIFSQSEQVGNISFYSLYVLIGVVHFNFFAHVTNHASDSLHLSRSLVLNSTIPLEILVMRSFCLEAMTYLFEMLCVIILVCLVGNGLSLLGILSFTAVVLGLFLVTIGFAFALAGVVILIRDLAHIWIILTRLLFFLTPVFYSTDQIHHSLGRTLVLLNPLTYLLELVRQSMLGGSGLAPTAIFRILGLSSSIALAGWLIFRRVRPYLPDYI